MEKNLKRRHDMPMWLSMYESMTIIWITFRVRGAACPRHLHPVVRTAPIYPTVKETRLGRKLLATRA